MCGRFAQYSIKPVIADEFGVEKIGFDPEPSYNIAPGQDIAAVVGGDTRQLIKLRWGLVPSWAKDPSIGYRMINARSETINEKPSFRDAFKRHRCLIIADGFYEWRKDGKVKRPFYIRLKTEKPFGFAGLYDKWRSPEGEEISTCTIITISANELLKPIHDRMPVVVSNEDEALWLDHNIHDKEQLDRILRPYDSEKMDAYEVTTFVNTPANNSEECIRSV